MLLSLSGSSEGILEILLPCICIDGPKQRSGLRQGGTHEIWIHFESSKIQINAVTVSVPINCCNGATNVLGCLAQMKGGSGQISSVDRTQVIQWSALDQG